MRLHGNSIDFASNAKAPMIQSFSGQTLGTIIGAIATTAGVTASVDPSIASVIVPYLNQYASSMHLLTDLEKTYDGMVKFGNGFMSFTQRGTGLSASGQSVGTFTLIPEDFDTGSFTESDRHAYSKVRASWWDKINHQLVWLDSTVTGQDGAPPYAIKNSFPSQEEAQSAADAQMRRLNRKVIQGTLTLAKGYPAIRGGQIFSISGTRDGIDGTYCISRAIHTLTKQEGIVTTIDCYTTDDDGLAESVDGSVDTSMIPATVQPAGGGTGAM